MRERWAAIPEFQRTRGALRFLAACLRSAHRAGTSRAVLGPGDVPMHDPAVRLAFFKEVGQQADFQAVLEHDLIGANARARRIDERRAKEFPAEALKRPATRIATAIMMYSFGGKRREGAREAELLPPGISEPELLSVCVGPDEACFILPLTFSGMMIRSNSTAAVAPNWLILYRFAIRSGAQGPINPSSLAGLDPVCSRLHFDGIAFGHMLKFDPVPIRFGAGQPTVGGAGARGMRDSARYAMRQMQLLTRPSMNSLRQRSRFRLRKEQLNVKSHMMLK